MVVIFAPLFTKLKLTTHQSQYLSQGLSQKLTLFVISVKSEPSQLNYLKNFKTRVLFF